MLQNCMITCYCQWNEVGYYFGIKSSAQASKYLWKVFLRHHSLLNTLTRNITNPTTVGITSVTSLTRQIKDTNFHEVEQKFCQVYLLVLMYIQCEMLLIWLASRRLAICWVEHFFQRLFCIDPLFITKWPNDAFFVCTVSVD